MAWVLQFDSVNDYIKFASPVVVGTGDFTERYKFKYTGGANQVLTANNLNNNDVIRITNSTTILVKLGGTSANVTLTSALVASSVYTIKVLRSSGVVDITNDIGTSLAVSTVSNTSSFVIYGFGTIASAGNLFGGDLYFYEHYSDATSTNLVHSWDATASSHAAGAPVLTDTIGGNNATGVNMPTDGSAWVDLGGGGLTLTADNGAFSTTFQPATLTYSSLTSYTITTDSGGFATTGQAVDLLFNRKLPVDSGDYSTTFNNADLLFDRALSAGSASYTTNFQDATLIYATAGQYNLVANSGSFNTSGTDLALLYDRALPVGDGAFNTTLSDASLSIGRRIQALSGDYTTTGQDISFLYNRVIMAQSGDFITTGYNVTLSYSGQPSQTIGTVTAGYKQDIYTAGYKPNSITVSFKE